MANRRTNESVLCIDATAGRGRDTLQLAHLMGDAGLHAPAHRVVSLDTAAEAVDSTSSLLRTHAATDDSEDTTPKFPHVDVWQDSHENMLQYVHDSEAVALVCFNLGYLPQLAPSEGRNATQTQPVSTATALDHAVSLLRPGGGLLTVVVYVGHGASGQQELDVVRERFCKLDPRKFSAAEYRLLNRTNAPLLLYCVRM